MNTLRLLLDLCLLRGRVQDLPASMGLVGLTAAASVAISMLALPDRGADLERLLFVATQVALLGGGVWLALRLRGFAARWMQTISALYAANAVFSLLKLPLLPALLEMMRQGPGGELTWQVYVALVVEVAFLAVTTRVLREALETGIVRALVAGVAIVFAVEMIGLVLAPLFGLTGQT